MLEQNLKGLSPVKLILTFHAVIFTRKLNRTKTFEESIACSYSTVKHD